MKDTADLRAFLAKERHNMDIRGHCRVDYTDPLTGRVLERVEGDNHVFTDQFICQNFQTTALKATLAITNGEYELDTDIPIMPGRIIGYGGINSSATGIYQGSYRSVDSYYNRITSTGVSNLYVYDFLTTQITDTIRYIGLTTTSRETIPQMPVTYSWPRDAWNGVYDIEHKILIHDTKCSLSNNAGGSGELYFYTTENIPEATSEKHDVFELCENPDNYWANVNMNYRGYSAQWGYDYENQRVVLYLIRYVESKTTEEKVDYYTWHFKEDWWVFNSDATEIVKHYTHENEVYAGTVHKTDWTYWFLQFNQFRLQGNFSSYFRLYGDTAYGMSCNPPTYNGTVSRTKYYVYQYDITSGSTSYEEHDIVGDIGAATLLTEDYTLYCYKGYMWTTANTYWGSAFTSTKVGACPVLDVYTSSIYSYFPMPVSSSSPQTQLIEKGETSIYANTWTMKPNAANGSAKACSGISGHVTALTAYQLPADAPVRPDNSAVTIAYGLEIKW